MSQMVTRQRTGGDEKEKRTESPVPDMKKKMAANAEKEKAAEQTASKSDKPAEKPTEKPIKPTEKAAEKPADKSNSKPTEKPAEKANSKATEKTADKANSKPTEKPADKPQKADKSPEKPAEKKAEKPAEKKDGPSEKKKEENGKAESSAKTDKPSKPDSRKQNGSSNGVNGTVSPESDSDSLVIDEADETELFPELAYDDSDVEWEQGNDCPSRSLTRRSQVKVTRTPETPRPASDKQENDESKDSKVLKLNQEAKPDAKKSDAKSDGKKDTKSDGKKDTAKDGVETAKGDGKKEVKESPRKEEKKEDRSDKVEVEVVVEIESTNDTSESRKPDTNFSKSRVKVSPYRRSTRLADQTASSLAANYTGNNTTMEMDITESSSFMDDSMDDSYLSGLRSIKGRRSYKMLKEMPIRSSVNRSVRSVTSTIVSEQSSRPTAPVVGRKRKPEPEDNVSIASEASESPVAGKRQRLLERLARPFKRAVLMPTRRNAEIVGINTDLPLSAPVASTSSFDPETIDSLKPAVADTAVPVLATVPVAVADDNKRCVIM